MTSPTVSIRCSLAMAKWLGAETCGEHELGELHFHAVAHKNFRVIPVDGPNSVFVFWKWPVVQPGDGKVFWEP